MDSALYPVRRWRLILIIIGVIVLGLTCYFIAPEFRRPGKMYLMAGLMAAILPFGLWKLATATDLAFDHHSIRYRGRKLRWSDIRSIRTELGMVSTRAGFVPSWTSGHDRVGDVDITTQHVTARTGSLFAIPGDSETCAIFIEWSGGTLRIDGKTIQLPAGGVIEIAQRMINLQRQVLGEQGAARARLGLAQERRSAGAPTMPEPPPSPALPRPSFGRKGV